MNINELEKYNKEKNIDTVKFDFMGFKCLIKRVEHLGHLCGYVGVESLSEDFDEHSIDVHGGITFFGRIEDVGTEMKEYFTESKYVLGFDCAHHMDFSPVFPKMSGEYRDIDYVTKEIKNMVKQLTGGK